MTRNLGGSTMARTVASVFIARACGVHLTLRQLLVQRQLDAGTTRASGMMVQTRVMQVGSP